MGRSRKHLPQVEHLATEHLATTTTKPRKKTLSATILLKQTAGKLATLAVSIAILSAVTAPRYYSPALAQESAQPSDTAYANYPLLTTGSTGESVSELQATLKLLGFYQGAIDGTYGQPTQAAVAQFQTAAGITADGITGPSTWQKLLPAPSDITAAAEAPATAQPAAAVASSGNSAPLGPPVLRAEAAGPAVAQLQRELQELGYYQGPIDGGFGAQTQASVEKFQADQQLFVDGVVGPSTWDALSGALDN
jgi:N-acetylmuramoyl-L-alanine amidase